METILTSQVFKCLILFLLFQTTVLAQNLTELNALNGHEAQVYYSDGEQDKASQMAIHIDKVMSFYDEVLDYRPEVTLLILSPEDWGKNTTFPVYGMPHYSDNQTLIVASEDNAFWKSFILPLNALPKETADLIQTTYSKPNSSLSMEPFFDLLALHELGHAYHIQGGLKMQRKWMGEFFSNIFLHTYVAENEPKLLPALTVLPKVMIGQIDQSSLKYTSLEDLELYYDEIGQRYPNNYGWYQFRWHYAAGTIYDAGGLDILKKLWIALKDEKGTLNDSEFINLLSQQVHKSVADVPLKWDKN